MVAMRAKNLNAELGGVGAELGSVIGNVLN
jgi:hypothetical protein